MILRERLVAFVHNKYDMDSSPIIEKVVAGADLGQGRRAPFTAVALNNGAVGISYNLFHRDPAAVTRYRAWDLGHMAGHAALAVSQDFLDDDLLIRTIGFATLNALCQPLLQRPPYREQLDFERDVLTLLAPSPSDRVGMVGYFPPTSRQLAGRVRELVIVEKESRLIKEGSPLVMTTDPAALNTCNKVLITATTILNDSLESLMVHCQDARFVAVMGPSAGICPEPLYDLGVNVLGGTLIHRPDLFMDRFASGEKWGDAKRKFTLHPKLAI